ncbi:MAG: hypothetical protein ACE5HO_19105 [bacterium]
MSLVKDIQQITERTYEKVSGLNLEEFVVGKRRYWALNELCTQHTRGLSDLARIFFRVVGDQLYMAIYYSDTMIRTLENNDPRRGLNEKNILSFLIFVEELNHAVHAALKFLAGERQLQTEDFIRDLELQAKIDCYQTLKFFVAYFNDSKQLEYWDRLWLRFHLFERGIYAYENPNLRSRYHETNLLGEKYTRYLDSLNPQHRLNEIRRFRGKPYPIKKRYIQMLP